MNTYNNYHPHNAPTTDLWNVSGLNIIIMSSFEIHSWLKSRNHLIKCVLCVENYYVLKIPDPEPWMLVVRALKLSSNGQFTSENQVNEENRLL